MRIIVLGAAAGGGFPQWNSACPVGQRAWRRDPQASWRTQCSLAVSRDGDRWALLNAAPDLRQQILATPALQLSNDLKKVATDFARGVLSDLGQRGLVAGGK